jgi:PAS domain S-box-containing protein
MDEPDHADQTLVLLLVEDDPADTSLVIQQLDRADVVPFRLRVAVSIGDAEVAVTNDDDVDCILLDLALPDSDGIASVERIHRLAPHLPIIVLTGRDEGDLALRAIEAGAQDFLVKGVVRGNSILRCARWAVARMRASGVGAAAADDRWRLGDGADGSLGASLLDRNDAPIVYLDVDMAIRFANAAFTDLVGYTEHDLVGAPLTDLLVVDDLIGSVLEIRSVMKAEEPATLAQVALHHRGGRSAACTLAITRVDGADGPSLLVVVVDVGANAAG